MKKNIVIILLSVIVVLLFMAYNQASEQRNELAISNAKYYEELDHVFEYGRLLYSKMSQGIEAENLVPNTMSLCDKNRQQCVNVDINGNLWVIEH